jgi:hypothetical protein
LAVRIGIRARHVDGLFPNIGSGYACHFATDEGTRQLEPLRIEVTGLRGGDEQAP